MELIVPTNELICKFIKKYNLDKVYSEIVIKHLISFMIAACLKGFTGKMTDVAEVSECHRTTISHFLSEGKWDEKYIQELIKAESYKQIEEISTKEKKPIFISIDDTVNCKTKPSSQARNPMQGTGFHHSHLLGKQVWGHQVQATMISCCETALVYDIHRYMKQEEIDKQNENQESKTESGAEKNKKKTESKIDYAVKPAESLPESKTEAYALTDSWYTCPKVINAFAKRGYHFIGALKTNRIIYPKGIHISIEEFATKYIELSDVDLVTVNSNEYYVYRYEGDLNDIENAVVLMSWPKNAFKKKGALKAFICTNVSLNTKTILEYYAARWCIEVFFKQQKVNLGFDKYQIRSIKGIERLWLIMSLVHLLCITSLGHIMPFGEGLRFLRREIHKDQVAFIYDCAQKNVPMEKVLECCA